MKKGMQVFVIVLLAFASPLQGQGVPTLAWDHNGIDTVGYLVSIDGVSTDVGLSGCPTSCRFVLPVLAPGPHTFVVTAYNDAFSTASDALTKSVPQKPVGVKVIR